MQAGQVNQVKRILSSADLKSKNIRETYFSGILSVFSTANRQSGLLAYISYLRIRLLCNYFLDTIAMRSTKNYFAVLHKEALSSLGLLIFCVAVLLSGCKNYGPIGTSDFDPTYSQTLEKNEQLLYSAQTELIDGTFMEGEQEDRTSYLGVLLLTNERVMFARWNDKQQRYEPSIWTGYSYISKVKMHNNILLQYIAIAVADGSKYTYLLGKQSIEQANAILMENIEKHQKASTSVDKNI